MQEKYTHFGKKLEKNDEDKQNIHNSNTIENTYYIAELLETEGTNQTRPMKLLLLNAQSLSRIDQKMGVNYKIGKPIFEAAQSLKQSF